MLGANFAEPFPRRQSVDLPLCSTGWQRNHHHKKEGWWLKWRGLGDDRVRVRLSRMTVLLLLDRRGGSGLWRNRSAAKRRAESLVAQVRSCRFA